LLSFDRERWIPLRGDFLFPVKALSKKFRGKFVCYLKQAFTEGRLIFPGKTAPLADKKEFSDMIGVLWKKDWVVYSKQPFAGPEQVLDYLGRYTHRVAISNNRIISACDGLVTFNYRNRGHNDKLKAMTLGADEFIRRFLLHVLPLSFVRIRHFGFLANRSKRLGLSACRKLLDLAPALPVSPKKNSRELLLQATGIDLSKCPLCKKGVMRIVSHILSAHPSISKLSQPPPFIWDSS